MYDSIRNSTGASSRRRTESKYKVVDKNNRLVCYTATKKKADEIARNKSFRIVKLMDAPKNATAKKSPKSKSTTAAKSTPRKPSSKANKGTKSAKTYASTPKKKKTESVNDEYLTIADFKKGYNDLKKSYGDFKSKMPGYTKKSKEIATDMAQDIVGPILLPVAGAAYGYQYAKKKYTKFKTNAQAKSRKKYNDSLKSKYKTDEDGVIIVDEPIQSSESDKPNKPAKKKFKFW